MPKRAQQAGRAKMERRPPEPASRSDDLAGMQLVVIRVGEELLAFKLDRVSEIVRIPRLAHMPLTPPSLLGLANLRGVVLPVVSLGGLLGVRHDALDDQARIVVISGGVPIGFVVNRIDRLLTISAEQLSTDPAGAGRFNPALLDGVVQGVEGADTTKVINPERVLEGQFDRIGITASPNPAKTSVTSGLQAETAKEQPQTALVSFDLGTQEYALPLERVREIVPLPENVSDFAGSENVVLGVVTSRDRLLPLVSLSALLGLTVRGERQKIGKVIVVSMGNSSVGIVAERTREILRVDPSLIDEAPALLTRGAGEAEIESICRLENGRRLVAILSPDNLFRTELVRRVLAQAGNDNEESASTERSMSGEQLIVFRLGDQEYGLPIAAVTEIARVPEHVTCMPKAPAFIEGIINLRGTVLPIVDLRRRFGVPSEDVATRRILVLAAGGVSTGFVVDSVSEVLKVATDSIEPAPELSSEQMRLIGRVVNLRGESRIILLIDPEQLLTEGEASAVAELADKKALKRS